MPLRIAFDLDGVLADMESELVRQAVVLFGERTTRRLQKRGPRDVDVPAASAIAGGDKPEAGDLSGQARQRPTPQRGSGEPRRSSPETPASERGAGQASGSDEATHVDDVAPAAPLVDVAQDALPVPTLNMTARQERRLWRHVKSIDNFWETLEECEPGLVARLASIATDRRWEIIFLTRRPGSAGATAQVQTQRWLASKGFALPSVFVVQRSRGALAAALEIDIVIDDRPENCLDVVVDSSALAILVWRADQKLLPPAARRLGIGVVSTVSHCLDILEELDTAPDHRPGVVARVMRLLGLKEPTKREPLHSTHLEVTQQAELSD